MHNMSQSLAAQEALRCMLLFGAAATGAWAAAQLDQWLLREEARPAVAERVRLQADAETRVLLANLKVCWHCRAPAAAGHAIRAKNLVLHAACSTMAAKQPEDLHASGVHMQICMQVAMLHANAPRHLSKSLRRVLHAQEMQDAEQKFVPKAKPDARGGKAKPTAEKKAAPKEKGKENAVKKAPAKKDITVQLSGLYFAVCWNSMDGNMQAPACAHLHVTWAGCCCKGAFARRKHWSGQATITGMNNAGGQEHWGAVC